MKGVARVLFVCTGNLCRSPMAEGIMRALLDERKVYGVTVSSAGTHGLEGEAAERFAARVCERNGVDIRGHVARALDRAMIEESDLVVVMEEEHRGRVLELCPDAAGKTRLLTEFGEVGVGFIADPYGLPEWAFDACFDRIERNVRGLFDAFNEEEREGT